MKLKMKDRTAIKHHQSTMICEEEEIEDIHLRRSNRVSKAPAYLDDYIFSRDRGRTPLVDHSRRTMEL